MHIRACIKKCLPPACRRLRASPALFACALALFLLLLPFTGRAATLTAIQDLGFGRFATVKNDAQYSMAVTIGDVVTNDPEIVYDQPPHRGEYLLEGLTPDSAVIIDTVDGALTLNGGGGEAFAVTDFTDNAPVTDAGGTATLYIGATLKTSGTGVHYPSGPYSGTYTLIVSW